MDNFINDPMSDQPIKHSSFTEEPHTPREQKYLIPGSILAAGVLIALAIVYSRSAVLPPQPAGSVGAVEKEEAGADGMRPISADDHLLGNPEAPVKLVEYSDLECPFCKKYHHETLAKVIEEYVKKGKVAIVYRHLPLESIHTQARKEAEATECVGELGGNAAFWAYVDRIFNETPSNDGLDVALLPKFAADLGVNKKQFEECLANGRHADRVSRDAEDAVAAGVRGTPHTIIIAPNGDKSVINGAQPFAAVKIIIEKALATGK